MNLTCTVCFDNLFTGEETDVVYATQCGHIFHYECLKQWIHSSNTCPHCRQNVTMKNIIKLNVMAQIEPSSCIDDGRITRSTAKNHQSRIMESELTLKNTQLDLKVRELSLKNIELTRLEKKYKTTENNLSATAQENEKLKHENDRLKQEVSRLKTDLAKAQEKSTIIRSDLRIMDIIDLESDSSYCLLADGDEIDLTM